MKRFLNKVKLLPILAGILSSSVPMLNVALAAAVSLTMAINNTSSTSYTTVPFIVNTNNEMLIAAGNLLPNGLDSRVLDSTGHELPRMLADNNTLFTANSTAHSSSSFSFTTGNTPSATMPIITGVSGNVSTADAPDLEWGEVFDNSISGYFNTSTNGTNVSILYKAGAAKLNVSTPGILTFHALNADDSDNWTLTSGVLSSGNMTVRIMSDGTDAFMYVNGTVVDTQSLQDSGSYTVSGDASQGYQYQRAEGWFQNLYWIFYMTAGGLQWRTSADGVSWSANQTAIPVSIFDHAYGFYMFDDTIAYARAGTPGSHMAFRMGTLESSGNVTWLAAEQDINLGATITDIPMISFGIDHKAFVFVDLNHHYMYHNDNTDGTWSTTAGYPIDFGAFNNDRYYALVSDYDSNKAAVFWYKNGFGPTARYYNGAAWGGSNELVGTTGSSSATYAYGSAVFNAHDDVAFYWATGGSPANMMNVRDVSGSYYGEFDPGSIGDASLTYRTTNDSFYIFYIGSGGDAGDFMYKTWKSGVLSTAAKVGDSAATVPPSSSVYMFDHHISIGGVGGGNVYHAFLTYPWTWLSNGNTWWWMTNNTMSYADNISVSIAGTQMLFYAPNNMIYGNSLPDRSAVGTHTGTIYWGTSTLTVTGAALLTLPATNITTNSATLNGQLLDMVGMSSYTAYFDYGLTTSYGNTASFGVMSAPGLLSANATGLFPNATYHFRAVAVSSNITLYGGDLTFTTLVGTGGGTFQFGGGNARVFKNYLANNDTLVTAEIVNTYVPYYPNQSPKEYFTVQLISTDNSTILAATPQQDWGDKPIGIYLNPTQSATITDGAGYYVRVQANFASNVSVQYQLQNVPWANDWKGADLTKLDDWCIYVALDMQTFYSGSGYVTVLTDRKLAITDAVGGYFTAGIAGIGQVRPNLFTTSQQSPVFTNGVSGLPADNTTAYTAYVGSAIAADAAVLAVPFGLTARDVLAAVIGLSMLGVIMTGVSAMGGFGALGLFLISIPFLWLGTYFKIIGVQWVMILTIIFGFFAVRQFIIKTT